MPTNEEIRTEAVRALGFNKASRTQLEKTIALIDAVDPVEPPVEEPPDDPAVGYTLHISDVQGSDSPVTDGGTLAVPNGSGVWARLEPDTPLPDGSKVTFTLDGAENVEVAHPWEAPGSSVPAWQAGEGEHTVTWRVDPAGDEGSVTFTLAYEEADEPAPPPGEHNEPAGMTDLFGSLGDTPGPNLCNDQPDSNFDKWGWRGQSWGPEFLKVVNAADSEIPPSPASVDPDNFWQMTWPKGWGAKEFGSGTAGMQMYHNRGWTGKRAQSMYWRFYFYLPSGFETHPAMMKGWWFTHGGHTNHFVPMRANLGGGFGSNDAFGCYLQFNHNDTTRPAVNMFWEGISWNQVPRDRWIKLEFLFVANSDGNTADGKYRCWLGGDLVVEHDDVHFFSPLNFELNEFFNRISYGPVWGGGGDNPTTKEQSAALDDWYVSFSRERVTP